MPMMLFLGACGFTPAGVTAGSIAAVWQSGIGNVAAGSIFAACQSLGERCRQKILVILKPPYCFMRLAD